MYEFLGYSSGILFSVAFLPQIIKTFRQKIVDDISIGLWGITAIAYFCGLAYGFHLEKAPLILSYTLGLIMTSIVIGQWAFYKKKGV